MHQTLLSGSLQSYAVLPKTACVISNQASDAYMKQLDGLVCKVVTEVADTLQVRKVVGEF